MAVSEEAETTLALLETAIHNHFRQLWADGEVLSESDMITDWTVVVYSQDLDKVGTSSEYSVETSRGLPPHSIKGLLNEGIDWVVQRQEDPDE